MAAPATSKTEAELLHDMCIKALKEEHRIQLQLDALQLKLKRLRHIGRKLDTELSGKYVKSDDAFRAYAKKTCLYFCDKIRKALPREIRDVIYTYVIGCEDVNIAKPQLGWCQLFCFSEEDNQKHYWNAAFVGKAMIREMGENLFCSVTFQFHDRFNLMAKFRTVDQWTLGFSPVAFVKNVKIEIIYDGHNFLLAENEKVEQKEDDIRAWGGDPWSVIARSPDARVKGRAIITPSELLVHMESLFGFRPGTALTIRVCMGKYMGLNSVGIQGYLCEDVVPLLFSILQRLKEVSFRVRIALVGGYAHGSTTFMSEWNPASVKECIGSFQKYADLRKKAEEEVEIWAVRSEMFSEGDAE